MKVAGKARRYKYVGLIKKENDFPMMNLKKDLI
jgi:hypothetical protein